MGALEIMHHAHANLGAVVLAVRQHEHLRVEHLRHRSQSAAPSVAISADAKDHQQINGDQGGQRGGNHHLLVPPLPPSLRQSVAISGNQWQSVAISGNQWQSVAIITCWSHPDACESEYATRRSSSIAFSVGRKNAQPTLSVKCCTLQPARGGGARRDEHLHARQLIRGNQRTCTYSPPAPQPILASWMDWI